MAQRTTRMMITALAAGSAVAAGAGVAVAAPSDAPAAAPNAVKPAVEVVAGTLSTDNLQVAVNQAAAQLEAMRTAVVAKWQGEAAMKDAVVAKWQAEAEAARIAAEQAAAAEAAAAAQAAYEQAVAAAVVGNWQAQAAAEAQAAYYESVAAAVVGNWQSQAAANAYTAPTYSAPTQTYSAPTQTYSAPAPAYSAPAPTYSGGGASGDASSWASSGAAMAVKQCESGNNYSTNTGNGYYGAWQFDIPSWLANGGGAYAATPDQAPAWAQDQVAYNYYQSAGWGPWACAQ